MCSRSDFCYKCLLICFVKRKANYFLNSKNVKVAKCMIDFWFRKWALNFRAPSEMKLYLLIHFFFKLVFLIKKSQSQAVLKVEINLKVSFLNQVSVFYLYFHDY